MGNPKDDNGKLAPDSTKKNDSPSPRKIRQKAGNGKKAKLLAKDPYCYECHRNRLPRVEITTIACSNCPRSYHSKCIKAGPDLNPTTFVCQNCVELEKEKLTKRGLPRKRFNVVLNDVLTIISPDKNVSEIQELFCPTSVLGYSNNVVHPIGFDDIRAKTTAGDYEFVTEFLDDVRRIFHNCCIVNKARSALANRSRAIYEKAKKHCALIRSCAQCYEHELFNEQSWFCQLCTPPHLPAWAKVVGFPAWPCKVIKFDGTLLEVRFFGTHERSYILPSACRLFSKEPPQPPKMNKALRDAIKEVQLYISQLVEKFGAFNYAQADVIFDPNKENVYREAMIAKEDETDSKRPCTKDNDTGFQSLTAKRICRRKKKSLVKSSSSTLPCADALIKTDAGTELEVSPQIKMKNEKSDSSPPTGGEDQTNGTLTELVNDSNQDPEKISDEHLVSQTIGEIHNSQSETPSVEGSLPLARCNEPVNDNDQSAGASASPSTTSKRPDDDSTKNEFVLLPLDIKDEADGPAEDSSELHFEKDTDNRLDLNGATVEPNILSLPDDELLDKLNSISPEYRLEVLDALMFQVKEDMKASLADEIEKMLSLDKEKKQSIRQLEFMEKRSLDAVQRFKSQQWCAHCKKAAVFHCCWKAPYCSPECQFDDWESHMSICTQREMSILDPYVILNPFHAKMVHMYKDGTSSTKGTDTETDKSVRQVPEVLPNLCRLPISKTRTSKPLLRRNVPIRPRPSHSKEDFLSVLRPPSSKEVSNESGTTRPKNDICPTSALPPKKDWLSVLRPPSPKKDTFNVPGTSRNGNVIPATRPLQSKKTSLSLLQLPSPMKDTFNVPGTSRTGNVIPATRPLQSKKTSLSLLQLPSPMKDTFNVPGTSRTGNVTPATRPLQSKKTSLSLLQIPSPMKDGPNKPRALIPRDDTRAMLVVKQLNKGLPSPSAVVLPLPQNSELSKPQKTVALPIPSTSSLPTPSTSSLPTPSTSSQNSQKKIQKTLIRLPPSFRLPPSLRPPHLLRSPQPSNYFVTIQTKNGPVKVRGHILKKVIPKNSTMIVTKKKVLCPKSLHKVAVLMKTGRLRPITIRKRPSNTVETLPQRHEPESIVDLTSDP